MVDGVIGSGRDSSIGYEKTDFLSDQKSNNNQHISVFDLISTASENKKCSKTNFHEIHRSMLPEGRDKNIIVIFPNRKKPLPIKFLIKDPFDINGDGILDEAELVSKRVYESLKGKKKVRNKKIGLGILFASLFGALGIMIWLLCKKISRMPKIILF